MIFFYNIGNLKKDENNYKKAIKYRNKEYLSICEASTDLNISETSIRRKLKNVNEPEFEYIDCSKQNRQLVNIEKAKPVYVNGIYYRSERYASKGY